MRGLSLLLSVAFASASYPTQLLFNFTATRYPWSVELQLAELRLFSADGHRIGTTNVSNPDGTAPYPNQMAFAATDGRVETRWVDAAHQSNGHSLLYVTPLGDVPVAYCMPRPLDPPCAAPVLDAPSFASEPPLGLASPPHPRALPRWPA